LPCETGTVTYQKVGIGTVINYSSGTEVKWYHKSSQKPTVYNKLNYNKFDETFQFLPCKKA
jgi:hypothetical protein